MIVGLFRAITYLTVPRYWGNRQQRAQDDGMPVPSAVLPAPVRKPYQWQNPHLVDEYHKLVEDYDNDPEQFGTILRIVLRSMYNAHRSDVFPEQQAGTGNDTGGPEPDAAGDSSQPVEPVPAPAIKIRPGWYFYADGKLYDGFRTWNEINAAMTKLTKRGVSEFSEVEHMD